jgi:hypothetical protein
MAEYATFALAPGVKLAIIGDSSWGAGFAADTNDGLGIKCGNTLWEVGINRVAQSELTEIAPAL